MTDSKKFRRLTLIGKTSPVTPGEAPDTEETNGLTAGERASHALSGTALYRVVSVDDGEVLAYCENLAEAWDMCGELCVIRQRADFFLEIVTEKDAPSTFEIERARSRLARARKFGALSLVKRAY